MFDPSRLLLWASILSFKSLLLTAGIALSVLGPSLWRGRRWWIWILPRSWRNAASSIDDRAARRWFDRMKMVFWGIALALAASWLLLAYRVTHR